MSDEKPKCCGECVKYCRDRANGRFGYCDNWAGVRLTPDCVCHPNTGIKKSEVKNETVKA